MATEKQTAANQRNAKKSTGPKTPTGKRKSSRNALLHGFTAKTHSLDCENEDDYRNLLDHYLEHYQPDSEAEREIIEQLTHSQWNLRRTRLIEKGLLDELYEEVLKEEPSDHEWEASEAEDNGEEYDGHLPGSQDDYTRRLANAFRNGSRGLVRCTRYAAHFSAQWWRCYRTLEKLQPPERPLKPNQIIGFDSANPNPSDKDSRNSMPTGTHATKGKPVSPAASANRKPGKNTRHRRQYARIWPRESRQPAGKAKKTSCPSHRFGT